MSASAASSARYSTVTGVLATVTVASARVSPLLRRARMDVVPEPDASTSCPWTRATEGRLLSTTRGKVSPTQAATAGRPKARQTTSTSRRARWYTGVPHAPTGCRPRIGLSVLRLSTRRPVLSGYHTVSATCRSAPCDRLTATVSRSSTSSMRGALGDCVWLLPKVTDAHAASTAPAPGTLRRQDCTKSATLSPITSGALG